MHQSAQFAQIGQRAERQNHIVLTGIRQLVESGAEEIPVTNKTKGFTATMKLKVTDRQRQMLLAGGLINMIAGK